MLDNGDPRLSRAWHAAAAGSELGDKAVSISLLGKAWSLRRDGSRIIALADDGSESAQVCERYGLIWLAPQEAAMPAPVLGEMADSAFATGLIAQVTAVSAGVLIDNFLDVSHFSYLHRATFGRVSPVTTSGCRVERDGWVVRMTHETDMHEGATDAPAGDSHSESWRVATYSVLAPYVVHLQMLFPASGSRSAATFVCRPDSDEVTTVYVLVAWPAEDPAGLQEQLEFSLDVLAEDLGVLELMADSRLELSLHAELHTKADRASVEYRRLMSDYLALGAVTRPEQPEAASAAHR